MFVSWSLKTTSCEMLRMCYILKGVALVPVGAEDIVHFPIAKFSTGWHKLHEKRVWKGTKMLFTENFLDRWSTAFLFRRIQKQSILNKLHKTHSELMFFMLSDSNTGRVTTSMCQELLLWVCHTVIACSHGMNVLTAE